jgi:hypothetical protein
MVKRVISVLLCILMLGAASLAVAGGPPPDYRGKAYAPPQCGPGGPQANCAYWGDAPFPGLCGGVVALPFLVAGSLLGGNTAAQYGPPPGPRYGAPPPPYPPRKPYGPPSPRYGQAPQYGQAPYGGTALMGGLGCYEFAADIFGAVTGGSGILY